MKMNRSCYEFGAISHRVEQWVSDSGDKAFSVKGRYCQNSIPRAFLCKDTLSLQGGTGHMLLCTAINCSKLTTLPIHFHYL